MKKWIKKEGKYLKASLNKVERGVYGDRVDHETDLATSLAIKYVKHGGNDRTLSLFNKLIKEIPLTPVGDEWEEMIFPNDHAFQNKRLKNLFRNADGTYTYNGWLEVVNTKQVWKMYADQPEKIAKYTKTIYERSRKLDEGITIPFTPRKYKVYWDFETEDIL